MTTGNEAKIEEINRNFGAFLQVLPEIIAAHAGEYALLHDGAIIAYFPTALKAQIAGNQRYEPSRFSIQHVDDRPEELGFYSYAIHPRPA